MQRLMSLLLKRAGYRVDVVAQGNQAIGLLDREEYDAILLDLMMPHEGGMTVIRHLRSNNPALLRRTILVTGAPESLLQPMRGEIFGVLRKPFDATALMQIVERLTAG